jgi:hypothetical protein
MGEDEEARTTQDDPAAAKAREEQEDTAQAKEEMRRLEEQGPPDKLEDWPDGKAKYQTFGGPDGQSGYEEGATSELGPADLRYHENGKITIAGEEVENPDDYRGDPIPGGPTDDDARDDVK